jgi:HK97 family phage portal protein
MLNWLKRTFTRSLENPNTPFSQWTAPPTLAGVSVDKENCLTHVPVYAAINCISSDVSLLDIAVEETLKDGSKRKAAEHPLHNLLAYSPDGEISSRRWRQTLMGHVLIFGNAYARIEFDGSLQPRALHLLDPRYVTCKRDGRNRLFYSYSYPSCGTEIYQPFEVLHFAGYGHDGIVGHSPIDLARESLGLGIAADRFGAGFFGNAARPSGVLTKEGVLSDTARKNLQQSFDGQSAGAFNAGRTLVLEEGLTWAPIQISPDEAQFSATQLGSIQNAARLFRVPPHKIGDMSQATFSNIEEQNLDYLQTTLLNACDMIETEIELKLIVGSERGRFHVSHDFRKLLKANAAARSAYNVAAIQNGWATRNRIAQDEGYEPYKGGELPLMPLNFMVVGADGVPIPNPTPPVPPKPEDKPATQPAADAASLNLIRKLSKKIKKLERFAATPKGEQATTNAAIQSIARSELARALRRESAAVTRALGKPNFRASLEKIYIDHEAYLKDALAPSFKPLGIDVDAFAGDWCGRSLTELESLEEVTTSDQRPAAVAELLASYEARIDTAWTKNDAT